MAEPSLLADVRDRALSMRGRGDIAGALDYLWRVLESARSAFGADDPQVLQTGRLLAALHRDIADLATARRLVEDSLAAAERRLGGGHPVVLELCFDLAVIADELGNRHEARRNFAQVAATGPAVLGDGHWQVRTAREYLSRRPPGAAIEPTAAGPAGSATVIDRPATPDQPATPDRPAPRTAPQATPAPARTPTVRQGRQRTPGVVAVGTAAAAFLAATVAVVVGVAVLLDRGTTAPVTRQEPDVDPTPTTLGEPPANLRITDDRTAVTITWTDPTAGTVPFVVASGRHGQQLGALTTIDPGQTTFTVNGLNPELDYCFAILAAYSTNEYSSSDQVCTQRFRPVAE
ncbi:tetratricopeptide repeat protein [Solwaraspora sp. WMMB335]|uniref:fibronectin type III domain-containing protein n=1 Tax=Solwaraspora sp. WMMB335 TaxID=3404118 RepID=UPI003B9296DC